MGPRETPVGTHSDRYDVKGSIDILRMKGQSRPIRPLGASIFEAEAGGGDGYIVHDRWLIIHGSGVF